jgi:hypothetical protein
MNRVKPHPYEPNRKGKCLQIVGGRKTGYRICHEGPDAEVHTSYVEPHTHRTTLRFRCDDCGEEFDYEVTIDA